MLKTIASLGKEKYERIGATKAKEILKGMDYMTRSKLKSEAVNLGTGKVSVLNFTKRISKTHGSTAASKFIGAVQKHYNDDIDPKIQKRYMKVNMQRDKLPDSRERTIQYAGGSIANKSISQDNRRVKGVKENLNVGTGIKTGFAQNFNKTEPPSNSAPKMPPTGTRPIGL